MPDRIQIGGNTIEYVYDASGVKRETRHKTSRSDLALGFWGRQDLSAAQISETLTTDYISNKVYEQYKDGARSLKFLLTDEGYLRKNGSTFTYYYHVRDHLGNTRVVMDGSGNIAQVNNYYPFGATFAEPVTRSDQGIQPYKYNGKELDGMYGMNLYDYGARFYDPALSRFMTMDPLAEKYYSISPYAYCANNPIKYTDPTGESVHLNRIGDVMAEYDDGDNGVYTHNDLSNWDNESVLEKSGDGIKTIGALGGTIDMNDVLDNRLAFSEKLAKDMNIVDFGLAVKAGSEWDFKANEKTIWGTAWKFDGESENKTIFTYGNFSMTAADVGNFHYGYAGKYTYKGAGMLDIVLETAAGAAEIKKNINEGNYLEAAKGSVLLDNLIRPYGDRKIDNDWIRAGMWRANKNKNKK